VGSHGKQGRRRNNGSKISSIKGHHYRRIGSFANFEASKSSSTNSRSATDLGFDPPIKKNGETNSYGCFEASQAEGSQEMRFDKSYLDNVALNWQRAFEQAHGRQAPEIVYERG
jgi:hypothetical protein